MYQLCSMRLHPSPLSPPPHFTAFHPSIIPSHSFSLILLHPLHCPSHLLLLPLSCLSLLSFMMCFPLTFKPTFAFEHQPSIHLHKYFLPNLLHLPQICSSVSVSPLHSLSFIFYYQAFPHLPFLNVSFATQFHFPQFCFLLDAFAITPCCVCHSVSYFGREGYWGISNLWITSTALIFALIWLKTSCQLLQSQKNVITHVNNDEMLQMVVSLGNANYS